jgi:hypothetical protein
MASDKMAGLAIVDSSDEEEDPKVIPVASPSSGFNFSKKASKKCGHLQSISTTSCNSKGTPSPALGSDS